MMLSNFIDLVARLENVKLEEIGDVKYLPPLLNQQSFDYQQMKSLHTENTTYQILSYNVPLKTLEDSFKNLRIAIDGFDQDKAFAILKKLTATFNARSTRATDEPKPK